MSQLFYGLSWLSLADQSGLVEDLVPSGQYLNLSYTLVSRNLGALAV